MKEIIYELTKNEQKVGGEVRLTLPTSSVKTGESVEAHVVLGTVIPDYNYYVVDWGDGTWSYNGVFSYDERCKATGKVYHTYRNSGEYQVRACGVNIEEGDFYGWTETTPIQVTGDHYAGNMITDVKTVASTVAGAEYRSENIVDGNNETYWRSVACNTSEANDYVGLIFDDYYTLDTLEIKFPSDIEVFPSNITIEYTTDGGKIWYMLPSYYYVLPNAENYYGHKCVMNFPNPKGATLCLPMQEIAANGVRIRALTYPENATSDKYLAVEEMRAYGKKGTLLYASYDGHYSADLSNMFAIFGTAKTEPNRGNISNTDPFRAGETMIGSVEWLAWNGAKLNWSGYESAFNYNVDRIKQSVYGGDGWYYDEATGKYVVDESEYKDNPRNDGYIWATSDGPKHLGDQNHYVYNSITIIAARDYLLSGNGTEGFLSSVNLKGQVMLDKLRKAMEYMLENLNGKSGLMTIYDPRNDGTVTGKASNYWDAMLFFGYNSAYENVFFYQSILAMADIEAYLGNTEEVARYTEIAKKVKKTFNDYFWDEKKGRYITSVNVKGEVLDFGVTFINFMAVAAGLASDEQAQLVYDWVDGKRIIEGDHATGQEIYTFKVAARSNTVDIASVDVEVDGKILHYWWYNGHEWADVLPGMGGQFGWQMQNGGTIFYISHYDVAGRTQLSADLAIERFNVIMDEFHIDSLRRDPKTKWGHYQVSINGEFPESGLVPLTFVTNIIGITPDVKGLKIKACLPTDMKYAGVSAYRYADRVYHIEVNKDLNAPEMSLDGDVYTVKVPADDTYYITMDNKVIKE